MKKILMILVIVICFGFGFSLYTNAQDSNNSSFSYNEKIENEKVKSNLLGTWSKIGDWYDGQLHGGYRYGSDCCLIEITTDAYNNIKVHYTFCIPCIFYGEIKNKKLYVNDGGVITLTSDDMIKFYRGGENSNKYEVFEKE